MYGDEEELKKDPINHLFKLYVRINSEMEEEKKGFEAKKAEGIDVTELEANSLDEQARGYFKMMVSSTCGTNPFETFHEDTPFP